MFLRRLTIIFASLFLTASPVFAQVIAPKPADGPLAIAIQALPANQRARFRAQASAAVGQLASWNFVRGGKTWEVEMRGAPGHGRGMVDFYIRLTVDGVVRGLESQNCEWSHQRIYNPPLKAFNNTYHEETDPDTGATVNVPNFVEDPAEALRQVIKSNLPLIIQPGPAEPNRTCSTTSTYYPSAGAASPVDGYVRYISGGSLTFASIIGQATGTTASVTDANQNCAYLNASTTTDQFDQLYRCIYCFNTSALGGDSISSATLSLAGAGFAPATGLGSTTVEIVSASPAATDNLVVGDFDSLGATSFNSTAVTSYPTSGYIDLTLNASGISNISKSGISKFGTKLGWDFNGSFDGTWASNATTRINISLADSTGTTSDPKLVIEHTAPAGNGGSSLLMVP